MNLEALTNLLRVAREAPEDRLHMQSWCEQAECGTAYCLAGWAAVDPWHRKHTAIDKAFYRNRDGIVWPQVLDVTGFLADHVYGIAARDARILFAVEVVAHMDPHPITK